MYVGRIYDDFPYHKASLSRREKTRLLSCTYQSTRDKMDLGVWNGVVVWCGGTPKIK